MEFINNFVKRSNLNPDAKVFQPSRGESLNVECNNLQPPQQSQQQPTVPCPMPPMHGNNNQQMGQQQQQQGVVWQQQQQPLQYQHTIQLRQPMLGQQQLILLQQQPMLAQQQLTLPQQQQQQHPQQLQQLVTEQQLQHRILYSEPSSQRISDVYQQLLVQPMPSFIYNQPVVPSVVHLSSKNTQQSRTLSRPSPMTTNGPKGNQNHGKQLPFKFKQNKQSDRHGQHQQQQQHQRISHVQQQYKQKKRLYSQQQLPQQQLSKQPYPQQQSQQRLHPQQQQRLPARQQPLQAPPQRRYSRQQQLPRSQQNQRHMQQSLQPIAAIQQTGHHEPTFKSIDLSDSPLSSIGLLKWNQTILDTLLHIMLEQDQPVSFENILKKLSVCLSCPMFLMKRLVPNVMYEAINKGYIRLRQ